MPHKPAGIETTKLALEILRRIPRNGKITASQIHAQLEHAGIQRDVRSIQRQLDELSQGFDIERDDRNKPYGYQWKPNAAYSLSVSGLTPQESLLLRLAEQQLRLLLPGHLLKSMEGFFSQAYSILRSGTRAQREREWLGKVGVASASQPLLPPRIDAALLEQATQALFENHWLDVGYVNANGEGSERRVMPLALVQQGHNLYLVVRYEGADSERHLALHRFRSCADTGLSFERPADFILEDYLESAAFGFGDGGRISVKFRISKESGRHLLDTPLSHDQSVKTLDDEYEIAATVAYSQQLVWWLRGFGQEVRVISPRQLKRGRA